MFIPNLPYLLAYRELVLTGQLQYHSPAKIPKRFQERLTLSGEILGLTRLEREVYEQENYLYNNIGALYLEGKEGNKCLVVPELSKKRYAVHTNIPYSKHAAAYLIRWGATLEEKRGEWIKVIEPDGSKFITDGHTCECNIRRAGLVCGHIGMLEEYKRLRPKFDFLCTSCL